MTLTLTSLRSTGAYDLEQSCEPYGVVAQEFYLIGSPAMATNDERIRCRNLPTLLPFNRISSARRRSMLLRLSAEQILVDGSPRSAIWLFEEDNPPVQR